jgi:hypothetical protein
MTNIIFFPRLTNTSPLVEWAVPQASKLKYTQLFNTTDKARTGFLSGVQARNIFLASQLPQAVLAQIWYVLCDNIKKKKL